MVRWLVGWVGGWVGWVEGGGRRRREKEEVGGWVGGWGREAAWKLTFDILSWSSQHFYFLRDRQHWPLSLSFSLSFFRSHLAQGVFTQAAELVLGCSPSARTAPSQHVHSCPEHDVELLTWLVKQWFPRLMSGGGIRGYLDREARGQVVESNALLCLSVWSMRLVLTNKVSTGNDESYGAGAACAKCVLGDRVKVTSLAALASGGKVEGSKSDQAICP